MSKEVLSELSKALSDIWRVFSVATLRIPRTFVFLLVGFDFLLLLIGLLFRSFGMAFFGFLIFTTGVFLGLSPGGVLRREQIERSIRKNLEYSDTLYIITSEEVAKRKVIQVAFKVLFRLRKEKPGKQLSVKIGSIDELKNNGFKRWLEVRT